MWMSTPWKGAQAQAPTPSEHLLGIWCSPAPLFRVAFVGADTGLCLSWNHLVTPAGFSRTSGIPLNGHDPSLTPLAPQKPNPQVWKHRFHLVLPIVYSFPAKFSSPVNLFSSKAIESNLAGNVSWRRGDLQICVALCQGWTNFFEVRQLNDSR